jgi:hypothetical protein
VKADSSSLRASWWNGGSEEIGGLMPTGAVSCGGDDAAVTEVDRVSLARIVRDALTLPLPHHWRGVGERRNSTSCQTAVDGFA